MEAYLNQIIADACNEFKHSKVQRRPQLVRAFISSNYPKATGRAALARLDASRLVA